jgi:hypothetical protein
MIKFIGLFWYPGSAGDFVQSLLLSERQYLGFFQKFNTTSSGRVVAKKNIKIFIKKFFNPTHLYDRIWKNNDIALLKKIANDNPTQTLIIPTHRIENINFLKKKLKNFHSIGIIYKKNMYPIVLKNFCKKIVSDNIWVNKTKFNQKYDTKIDQYYKNKNMFGEFFFKEKLKYGFLMKNESTKQFDYAIDLEDIYIGNISSLKKFIKMDRTKKEIINKWLSLQSKIHRFYFPLTKELKESLGFNSKAKKKYYNNVALDNFDNILIQNYIKIKKNINVLNNVPKFKNLKSASIFFKKYINNCHGTD